LPGRFAVNVVSPTAPVPPALTLDFGTTSPQVFPISAYEFDTAAGTYRSLPPRWQVYLKDGGIWQIPLTLSSTPAPVRVSDVNDACRINVLHPRQAAGRDGFAIVETAGADGNCATGGDSRIAVVQVGDIAPLVAERLPLGTLTLSSRIYDAAGNLLWMVGLENSPLQLVAYKPNFERVAISGGSGRNTLGLPADGPLEGGLWFKTRDTAGQWELLRLSGDSSTLSLSGTVAAVYSPSSGPFYITAIDAGSAFEIARTGDAVNRVAPDGTQATLATLDLSRGAVRVLAQNATHLFVHQQTAGGAMTWTAISKSGSASRRLLDDVPTTNAEMQVISSSRLIYRTNPGGTNGDLRSVDVATGVETTLATGVVHPSPFTIPAVFASVNRLSLSTAGTSGILACRPLAGTSDCRGGELIEINADTGAIVVLGNFANTTSSARITMSGNAVEGSPRSTVTLHATPAVAADRVSDVYIFQAGQAGSLRRVTNVIP
jgi:hypothetical protein